MGMIASIYKNKGQDYSNGGISSRHNTVTVVNVDGPFDATVDRPAVELVAGNMVGTIKVIPFGAAKGSTMCGGTYVGCSDYRFTKKVESILGERFYGAVSFHDRTEG